jgi:hypothetical protein
MAAASIPDHEKASVRAVIFDHLSGIALAPTVKALSDRKVFHLFEGDSAKATLDDVVDRTGGNRGYLRVALRLLASAGWLQQTIGENGQNPSYALTAHGQIAVAMAPQLYGDALSFAPTALFLEDFLFGTSDEPLLPSLRYFVSRARERWGMSPQTDPVAGKVCDQICRHLDGVVIGPAMVALARGGVLAQLESGHANLAALAGNRASLLCVFELLAHQGWAALEKNVISLTPCGLYAAQIATSYGVTVSYLPMFNILSTLLFGNPRIPRTDESGVELLVNRTMNVWGSGGAHKTYFKKVDEIIIETFNRPLNEQPQGICDMGCGDGTFLEHLYSVVKQHTLRGRTLDQSPLTIVGADFNKVARRVAKQTLRKAGIPRSHVIHGDINRPALLAGDLEELGLDIHDLLHVRSFLDHNRPYIHSASYVKGSRRGRCSGAFAHFGEEILPDELEDNLVRHLRRWAPYVGRFGLLVLELHTLPPEVAAANLERTPAVAYDGTHGFSDQYLVELPIFLECAKEAGLRADPRYQAKFPPSELATVSINFFTTAA